MSEITEVFENNKEKERLKRISLNHLKFITNEEWKILHGWGLAEPYIGEEVARTSTEHWLAWVGEPNQRSDVPLLVARTGLDQVIAHDSFWSYGYTTVQDLEQSTDRAETILDAAYLLDTNSGSRVLTPIIHSLAEIVPPQQAA